ncbi:transporter substrate-binding domain-containing protein [Psychromonas arctica]|uniref:transporter substrate-binding domain-containing protein n=1 Tax=Psychromonas arctica TaxID=168275 RepID=UPI002FD0B7F5
MHRRDSKVLIFILKINIFFWCIVSSVLSEDNFNTNKVIIIGGDYDYPPYEFINKEGKPDGYSVELSHAIADVMGFEIEIRLNKWSSARESLNAGEVDILQGMANSKEREHLYDFSPYTYVDQSVFARSGSPSINSLSDLNGHQVIVQRNGLMYDLLNNTSQDITLIPTDTHVAALRLLASGQYDYALVSNLPGLYLSKELGLSNIKPVFNIEGRNKYGYAVKKGNEELLAKFSQGLAILKNTGRQQAIYQKWLGGLNASPWTRLVIFTGVVAVVSLLISIVIIIWNRSLRKKVERRTKELKDQQLQLLHADKMASLGVLVSGVAHEINNPCGILTMNFPFIKDASEELTDLIDELGKESGSLTIAGVRYTQFKDVFPSILDDMHIASRKIRGIVDDLKHFASNDKAHLELNEMVDLNELVSTSIRLVINQIKHATDHFTVDYGDDLPLIKGSVQRIEQVLINLILNACQALDGKEQKIKITTYYQKELKLVIFTIKDHGVGIHKNDLSKLTDPFYTSKREQGGMGLGLSISAGIVRDHQGSLDFKSTQGKGTTVTLSLPLVQTEEHS